MKYKTLNSLWKEVLFALSGVGPGFLMIVMSAYLTDAINPSALPAGSPMSINGAIWILPVVFPVLIMIAKLLDGVVDIPLANLTDNLKSKMGKRRLPILVGFIPMVISYCMCWLMVSTSQTFMTVWIVCWSIVFFVCYSNNLLAFYGSIASVCVDSHQRLRVSSFKAFFDTLSYSACYALVPAILSDSFRIHQFAIVATPLMLTLIIPLFLIKEGEKFEKKCVAQGFEVPSPINAKPIGLFKSIAITFKSKSFMRWMAVNCCSFFGLQLFLVGMNSLITGGMELPGWGMTILNTFAFAPVPLMLYFFQKIKKSKGIKFAYQIALITFSICIMGFFFGSTFFLGRNNVILQYIIGCIGGVAGSFAIGAFLLMPTMLPAQIGGHEQTLTNKNHTAMFFAIQALLTTAVGAISSGLIYENIKMLFIDKSSGQIIWAENVKNAAEIMGVNAGNVFNFGMILIPFIASAACLVGLIFARRMPKNFSLREVATLNGRLDVLEQNPQLELDDENRTKKTDDFGINIALFVLTGGLFGLVWRFNLMAKLAIQKWWFLLTVVCPPLFVYITYKMATDLNLAKKTKIILIALSCLLVLNLAVYIVVDRVLYKKNKADESQPDNVSEPAAIHG